MALFNIFKKKKSNKEEPPYVSYSYVNENGQFIETIGYNRENTAKAFFDSLSQEELDKIKRTDKVEQTNKYICTNCGKEIPKNQTKQIANFHFCEQCAIPRAKQTFSNSTISKQKLINAAVRAVSEMLSKHYYYIMSDNSHNDSMMVFMLFLSRDKKTLLYIEVVIMQDDIQIITDRTITLSTEITDESLQKYILSNLGCEIKKSDTETIIDLINSKAGYEYVPVSRFEDLFVVESEPWKKTTVVGYDKVTTKPYLIEKDFTIDSISATLISLKAVVDYAKKIVPDSKFATITEENWETSICVNRETIDKSTTFKDPLLIGNDYFSVMMLFKEENGERSPLF